MRVRRVAAFLRGLFRQAQPSKTVGLKHGEPLSAAQRAEMRRSVERFQAAIQAQLDYLNAHYTVKVDKK